MNTREEENGSLNYAGMSVKIRCPKCKQQNFTTHETFEYVVTITIEDGVMPKRADDHQPCGIIGFRCRCNNCDHWWKPRGVKQLPHILVD